MQSGSDSGSSSSLKDDRLKKPSPISTGIDRFSDLPDSLICHILSLLPTKTVVATSILGTRWKSLWTKVTSIDVSYLQVRSSVDEARSVLSTRFAQIVNKVLIFRNAERLDKLWLDWEVDSKQEVEYVNIWVSYAVSKNLRSCSLTLLGSEMSEVNLPVPDTLFTCKTLEFLTLFGCFTLQVPTLVCLPKLQVLELYLLGRGSNHSIQQLISGYPVLRSLTIFDNLDPVYDKKLEIDAPNLEYLHLDVHTSDCSIISPSASLSEVILNLGKNCVADSDTDFMNGVYSNRCNSTVRLVETLNRAKCLSMRGDAMMAISRATVPLSTRFERLTKLKIDVRCCEWSSLSVMLGCCSRLQVFSIVVFGSCGDTDHKRCWKDPEQVPECLLSSLAHVSFQFLKGLEDQMSMVRYFLKHGSVLVSFAVSADPSMSDKKFQMLQAISEFPRLSSACSVKFA